MRVPSLTVKPPTSHSPLCAGDIPQRGRDAPAHSCHAAPDLGRATKANDEGRTPYTPSPGYPRPSSPLPDSTAPCGSATGMAALKGRFRQPRIAPNRRQVTAACDWPWRRLRLLPPS
mmetsp:Transcript_64690/g.115046  ORF Transcript_64690/g.115046 Transcript_64690/m.115046 type:complete len:117 (-) Transcript_64690:338-688(-)